MQQSSALLRELREELAALPEIEHAGLVRFEMFRSGSWNNPVTIQSERRFVTDDDIPMNAVSPGLFEALGVPVVMGRDFDPSGGVVEGDDALRAAVVNEEFVARYLRRTEPIGVRVGIGEGPDVVTRYEIAGVVRSFHFRNLRQSERQVFFSLWERPYDEGTFYGRSRHASRLTADSIRAMMSRVDPRLTVLSLRTIDDQLDRMMVFERILATAATAFAAVATLLAMIGLYALLSFSASLREKEMGVRLALGAEPWSASGLILREAAWLVSVGAVIALPVVWVLGRLVESWLFGVRPMDALTLVSASVVLSLACLASRVVPARRAGTASLIAILRSE